LSAVTEDSEVRASIAAALLFTVRPTDRALEGWCGTECAGFELTALGLAGGEEGPVTPWR
jgi:hypothetical protein